MLRRGIFLALIFFLGFQLSHGKLEAPELQARKIFKPVEIKTDTLSVTGTSFSPIEISTKELSIIGKLFNPTTIESDELTVTGKVFTPKTITTPDLIVIGKIAGISGIDVQKKDQR